MDTFRYTESENMTRSTHYGSNYYEFISNKTNKLVRCFSTLEYYNVMMLETNPKVTYYLVQPCKADVRGDDNRIHHLTPDVYVVYSDDFEEIQEVKPGSQLVGVDEKSIAAQEQISLERKWALANGMLFNVRSEAEIFENNMIYIANIIFVYHHSRFQNQIYDVLSERIAGILADNHKHPLRELCLITKQSQYNIICTVCRMYVSGKLQIDLKKKKFDIDSQVSKYGETKL